jgi:hypothetical protein
MDSSGEESVWIEVVAGLHVKVLNNLEPEKFWPLVDLAVNDSRVLEALRHFKYQDSWDALYRAFETVEQEVGGAMVRQGWATAAEVALFTHTANAGFRHASGKYQPPEKAMEVQEAVELIRKLLRAWIESRLSVSRA